MEDKFLTINIINNGELKRIMYKYHPSHHNNHNIMQLQSS